MILHPTISVSDIYRTCQSKRNRLQSHSGKHYVTLVVMTPTNLTEKQSELLAQFHELENAKNKEEKSSWSKKISLDLDKAWSRLKSFAGQSQS